MTQSDVNKLYRSLSKAKRLQREADKAKQELNQLLLELTGVHGEVPTSMHDDIYFKPSASDKVIPVLSIIESAEEGSEITEDFLIDSL